MQINIRVNGEPRRVVAPTDLTGLEELARAETREGIAVAVNGEIVPRRTWQEREVCDGDDIEIVHAVQGG